MSTIAKMLGLNLEDPQTRLAIELTRGDRVFLDGLVALRRKRMKQDQMAKLLGVSQSAVSQWETGDRDPKLSTIRAYAIALGVQYEHVLRPDEAAAKPAIPEAVRLATQGPRDVHERRLRRSGKRRRRHSRPFYDDGFTVQVEGKERRLVAP